jgi:hypothetical protein
MPLYLVHVDKQRSGDLGYLLCKDSHVHEPTILHATMAAKRLASLDCPHTTNLATTIHPPLELEVPLPMPPHVPAPAVFLGWQETSGWHETLGAPLALWTLTADIADHPAGSAVASATLRQAGYLVEEPPPPTPKEDTPPY